jgi:hypothetical protein
MRRHQIKGKDKHGSSGRTKTKVPFYFSAPDFFAFALLPPNIAPSPITKPTAKKSGTKNKKRALGRSCAQEQRKKGGKRLISPDGIFYPRRWLII